MTKNHHSNGNHRNSPRYSGYLTNQEIARLDQELERVARVDKIRNPSRGTLLKRMVGLRLDQASIAEYLKTHKQRRDEDPVRTTEV